MKPHVFGVRHLSPAAAWHLERFLNEVNPTAVLIEGPADMTPLLKDIARKNVKPPIAIMAYTTDLPIESIVYPLADYSPEYQAILWAIEHGAHVEFIDLPAANSFAIARIEHANEQDEEIEETNRASVYDEIASLAGEHNYESYWERSFEQIRNGMSFLSSINAFSHELRSEAAGTDSERERKHNYIRESYMRSRIAAAMLEGHPPEKTVVITGAFHINGLLEEEGGDGELKLLPEVPVNFTLMPYSNFRLSSRSGYGAGNHAPAYFKMMWECLLEEDHEKLPVYYLSSLAAELRKKGTFRSTAEVMEASRLAYSLASFRSGRPTLQDLRDSATMCLGHGDFSVISDACAKIEIGADIGELPEGVVQTPLQQDFKRRLHDLKLTKYKTNVNVQIQLDLRENRRVKSREAAFLDRHRSFFFHQLKTLGVGFAIQGAYSQDNASWGELWNLRWSPESEIQLVESTLLGETIELAVGFILKERLEKAKTIADASRVIRDSYLCGLMEMMEEARLMVARMGTETGDFNETASAIGELAYVLQFGDVRGLDTTPLIPLITRLFLRGTLLLPGAALCNNDAARGIMEGMGDMNETARQLYEHVDEGLWLATLGELVSRDDLNPLLSGYSCAVLLERNELGPEQLEQEVSRRLSPGIPADIGGGWFEGLCLRNRHALISRSFVWEQMDAYIATLSEEEFRRALVFLRRSFTTFTASDRARVAELLAGLWGLEALEVSEYLNEELSDTEESALDQLNDFDFGDW
ncbi:hypothetical protein A8F94_12515 [Bacillus sp. FJAT-27225]|uniref:DUF5682 family protein n=1 Tax=Bacillus sp. FJAT-27225 TaxID=1743144 RepID=UPI00080C2443|nr:DUF5682 family protein [Bacillus sp. FJAT-27225]OCA85692.1 hypothetical protein A8F94_12515 [Bacillus sp. FJAT-27225]